MRKLKLKTVYYNAKDKYNFPQERHIRYYQELRKIFFASAKELRLKGIPPDDPRYSFHKDILAATDNAIVFSKLIEDHTTSTIWWSESKLFKYKFDNAIVKSFNVELRMFVDFGYFNCCFMFVEDSLRRLLRATNPNLANYSTSEFNKVYRSLIETLMIDHKYVQLMNLFSEIRNSIHNNGDYFPRKKKNQLVTYKSRRFKFEYGKQINFVKWGYLDQYEFYLNLFSEINLLIVDIISSKKISILSKSDFHD